MPVPPYQRTRGSGLAGRVAGDVEKLSQTAGAGDVGFSQDGGGIQFKDTRAHGFWAVIESRYAPANSYGFTRVDDGAAGAYPALTSTTIWGVGTDIPAWEVQGRIDVPADGTVKVWMEPNKLGKGYTFRYEGQGTGAGTAGSCGGGCGSLLSAADHEDVAFAIAVLCNTGSFAHATFAEDFDGVSVSGAQFRRTAAATWTLQYWDETTETWLTWELNTGTVTGAAVLTFDATDTGSHGMPTLRVDGVAMRTACDERDAVFRGGPRNGFAGAGSVPTPGGCQSDDFTLRVSCACKWIDGWQGPGIYCVDQGDGCEPLPLTEDDACDTDLTICSGPYATLEEAEAVCGTVASACSPDRDLPVVMYATFSGGTGDCTCLDGVTIPMSSIVAGVSWGADCPVTTPCGEISNIAISMSCNTVSGLWTITQGGNCQEGAVIIYAASGPFSVTTGPSTPFDVTRTLAITGICTGNINVQITETPP